MQRCLATYATAFAPAFALAFAIVACSGTTGPGPGGGGGGDDDDTPAICDGITCSDHGTCADVGGTATCQCDGGYVRSDATTCVASVGPQLAGCPLMPADYIFNTPIDALPVHASSGAFITTIGGTRKLHLDLGTTTDQQANDFYGIPYNIIHGSTFTWPAVVYMSADPDLDWNPRPESDCAAPGDHAIVSPCTSGTAALPIPTGVIVEGGVNTAASQMPYGDHHIVVVDADTCRLWETYHSYLPSSGTWNIFGSATFDLTSNALRPADWSSSDAAGFPILPLLLRADEASTGTIAHALRFTIGSAKIRTSYTWPARHLTENGTDSTDLPQMGQLFRLKASFQIPTNAGTQTRAILQAMKTYGLYIADGGSDMYITGEASADWADETFSQVQAITADNFEAVDLTPIMNRAGFDPDSGRVP